MRKLGILTTLWTALLWLPISVLALGLGEIKVDSFLNQPLKAEIEVTAARAGEVDDLLVSLASRDAFRKAGLERPATLSKLRFQVEKSEDGQSASILVTSKTPIKEPFLNFLVEADWAKGRLLREYTILLDPPYFAQQPQPALTSEPAPAAESSAGVTAQPVATYTPEAEPEATAPQQPQPIALSEQPDVSPAPETAAQTEPAYSDEPAYTADIPSGGEIVVEKGDTLWALATPYKDAEHSMAQVMLAIQAANPDAFGDGNINNLKVGAVLRMPEGSEFDALNKQQAYAQVLEQNGLWDEYVARKTGAAMPGTPVAGDTAGEAVAAEDSGQLNLIAPGDEDSTTASLSDDGADVGQLRKELALAEEELEASRLENQDLRSRVGDLEAQIAKMEELQKLVGVEDSTLAQLQQQQAEEAAPDTTTGMVEEQPSDVMVEAADQIMAEESGEATEAPATDEMMAQEGADGMLPESGDVITDSTEAETVIPTVGEDTMMADGNGMIADESAAESEQVPTPAPVIITEPEPAGGVSDFLPPMDSLLGDPIILGGIGAILALILGLIFVKRRKSGGDEEQGITLEEGGDNLVDDDATPIHVPTEEEATAALVETVETQGGDVADFVETDQFAETEQFAETAIISADEMPEPEAGETSAAEQDQDDVLNEADVYLAYGLYDNAEELLKENLQTSPDRADYRAKLLDTHFATKNAGEFIKEAEALRSLGGAADRFWDRVQIMGYELAPDNELFAGAQDSGMSVDDIEFAKPESADFDLGGDDETDFSDTDFDLSGETQEFGIAQTQLVEQAAEDFIDTQTLAPVDDEDSVELPDIDELNAEVDLPDDIGDFDIDLDESVLEETSEIADLDTASDEDSLSFDLPDDLDLSADLEQGSAEVDEVMLPDEIAPEIDEPLETAADELEVSLEPEEITTEDEIELDVGEEIEPLAASIDDAGFDETMVIDADDVGTQHVEAALDLDMGELENAELEIEEPALDAAEIEADDLVVESGEDDITEFRPAEMTGEFEVPELHQTDETEAAEEAVSAVDAEAGLERTGTFAPGDFGDDELEAAMEQGVDDIEDLMLPDDVDEVGTKLDLAKAFIDMGDAEGARSSLEEVLEEGTDEQKAEATGLLEQIK